MLFIKLLYGRLSLNQRTACARAHFSECGSMTNAHSGTEQMKACCQDLPLAILIGRAAQSVLVGALFKKFAHFFEHSSYADPLLYYVDINSVIV